MTKTTQTSRTAVTKQLWQNVRWQHLAAGTTSGVVATVCVHPLELVKIRFQVDEGTASARRIRPAYSGIFDILRTVYRHKGVSGLYQGLSPNAVGAGASWGLYFFFYNALKQSIQKGDLHRPLHWYSHMFCGYVAGVSTLVMVNPVWVVKTRLCLQYEMEVRRLADGPAASVKSVSRPEHSYVGFRDALRKIRVHEGTAGLYKGLVPGLFGVSHGSFQFVAYEELKNRYNHYRNRSITTKLSAIEYITFAALSKLFASSITYPYQVVRSRRQEQHREQRLVRQIIVDLVRHEGVKGFYKGLVPNLIKVVPSCCITFLVYENMVRLLP